MNLYTITILSGLVLLVSACGGEQEPQDKDVSSSDVQKELSDLVGVTKQFIAQSANEFQKQLDNQMKQWQKELDQWKEENKDLTAEAQKQYEVLKKDFDQRMKVLNEEIQKLGDVSSEKLKEYQKQVKETWNNFQQSLKKLQEKDQENDGI